MRSLVLTLGFLALTTTVLGQGSIGGYGQGGGMGGGMAGDFPNMIFQEPSGPGGSIGGRFGSGKQKGDTVHQEPGLFDNLRWNSQTMIATAGVGCDWKFEGKAGEVLVAEAISDVFDASIKIVDEKGKVLVENDDRDEGNQAPLIVFRFEKDQSIKVNVGSFKNSSGGRFQFRSMLYKSFSTGVGETVVNLSDAESLYREGARTALLHFRAKKDETYYIRSFKTFTQNNSNWTSVGRETRVFGPTGIPKLDYQLIDTGSTGGKTLKALKDGDFFYEFQLEPAMVKLISRREIVKYETRPTTGSSRHTVKPGGQSIVSFPVSPDQPIRTAVSSGSETENYLVGPTPSKDQLPEYPSPYADENFGVNPTFCWFTAEGSAAGALRIFFSKGDATLVLTNHSSQERTFTIDSDEPLSEFTEAASIQDRLGIGHSKLYTYKSLPNEMMRLRSEGDAFRLKVDIFNYRGQIVNSFVDPINNKPGDDLYFPKSEKYLFRVSCVGNGGSGSYSIRRDPIGTESLSIGEKKLIKLDGKNFGIYELILEGGKRYSITSQTVDGFAGLMTMSEEGVVLKPNSHYYDSLQTDVIKVDKTGKYRIWVRGGGNANVTFKITPYKPPTIDD